MNMSPTWAPLAVSGSLVEVAVLAAQYHLLQYFPGDIVVNEYCFIAFSLALRAQSGKHSS
jgi:hypothetical protein